MSKKAAILLNKPINFAGGVERFNFYLADFLSTKGFHIDIFHSENVPLPKRFHNNFGINQLTYAISAHARKQKQDYKIIISNGGFGWGLGLPRPDQKFFNIYHGTTAGLSTALRPFLNFKSYFLPHYLTDGFIERVSGFWKTRIAVSESTKSEVRHAYGMDSKVVNNAVDTNHFKKLSKKIDFRKLYGIPLDAHVGLFCGRLDFFMKGIDRLVEIINQTSDIFWVLAIGGDASKLSSLLHINNYKIIENISYENMPRVYNCADFAVYLSRYEGNAYYLLEALACQLPVIATPAGAAAEIYRDPVLNRLLLPMGIDSPAFFEDFFTSYRLCQDRDFMAAFGEQARVIIENGYSLENWQSAMTSVLGLTS